jgi:hypothetical protein
MGIKASETTLNVNTSEAGFVSRSSVKVVAVKGRPRCAAGENDGFTWPRVTKPNWPHYRHDE